MTRTDGERIAALEERVAHVAEDVRSVKTQVQEMHDLLMQAKGARWFILAMASLAGFLAGIAHKFLPFIGK